VTQASFQPEPWIEDVIQSTASPEQGGHAREVLFALARETVAQLGSPELDFAPLLPDDEAPLDVRTLAMADWCSGVLAGIGSATVPPAGWPETVREVITDFAEIAKAAVGDEDSDEVNESSYTEIVEYLRASAQLVFEELIDPRDERSAGATDEAD
jgi:uncharacterized protein YgfB (UPF0149 family)